MTCMEKYSHFLLGANFASQIASFQPKTPIIEGPSLPERDRNNHYEAIKNSYDSAVSSGIDMLNQFQQDNNISADGVYLDIDLAVGGDSLKSLDSKSVIRLMNVTSIEHGEEQPKSTKATVYLPTNKSKWLDNKLNNYINPDKDSVHGPSNYRLINDINSINVSLLESFFSNRVEYERILPNEKNWYEVWVSNYSNNVVQETYEKLRHIDIEISARYIPFKNIIVFLIHADLDELEKLPCVLNYLSEIRVSKQPSILFTGEPIANQEWTELLNDSININIDDSSPIIGIIDTGVNNAHPLISSFLSEDRTDCVISGYEHIDNDGHGTGMGGICLFGDLTDSIYQRNSIAINHKLASIKIFSKFLRDQDQADLYGIRTENAVNKLENMGASIFCLAITEDDEDCWGIPSSWSADIDKILYHDGACDRIMLISAGNISDFENLTQDTYQVYCISKKIQSPAQALNAITVGAYTEKVNDSQYGNGGVPLAPPLEISPYSRTSFMWESKRIKPDIVLEGGNVLMHRILGGLSSTDLSLVTTSNNLNHSFQSFYATSAATALAANLIAQIKKTYPELSSLAIRALLVHSAEWTDGMKAKARPERLSMYGYGVPSIDRALNSQGKYVTYVFENSIVPYTTSSGGDLKYAGFQIFDLPWPSELLQSMGEETVRLKITLSYYIDPAPGEKGRLNRYRYPSASLYFDLKAPTESTESFIARHNKLNEAQNTATAASSRWEIGVRNRQSGSIQSDWLECTASELADCGQIMIYPGPGWWKEQKIDRIGNQIKYALVVSIETAETSIYSEIAHVIETKLQNQIQV